MSRIVAGPRLVRLQLMMEAPLSEVEMTKHNRDKYKISTPTPRATHMVDRVEAAADMVAMVDAEEVAGVTGGADIRSRV